MAGVPPRCVKSASTVSPLIVSMRIASGSASANVAASTRMGLPTKARSGETTSPMESSESPAGQLPASVEGGGGAGGAADAAISGAGGSSTTGSEEAVASVSAASSTGAATFSGLDRPHAGASAVHIATPSHKAPHEPAPRRIRAMLAADRRRTCRALRPYVDEVEAAAELQRLVVDEPLQLAFGAVRFGMMAHLVASRPPIEQRLMPGNVGFERSQCIGTGRIGIARDQERQYGVVARFVEHDHRERLLEGGAQNDELLGAARAKVFGGLQRFLHDVRPRPGVGAVCLEGRAKGLGGIGKAPLSQKKSPQDGVGFDRLQSAKPVDVRVRLI